VNIGADKLFESELHKADKKIQEELYKSKMEVIFSNKMQENKELRKEIKRLNNIINKLDRETYLGMIENQNNNEFSKGLYTAYKYINDKIKELKGVDKECK